MPWLQVAFEANRESASGIEAALTECGALSVTLQDLADDPLYEPPAGEQPLWRATRVTGLFEHGVDSAALLTSIAGLLQPEPLPAHHIAHIADQAWERAWIDDFQPMRFGQRLWICPSWCDPLDATAVNLLLDPGLAFGTGTHPTTALCLEALDAMDVTGKRVIDYGCGSGVLGIAALLLGAKSVLAIDNDPQALTATRNNAATNNIDDTRLATLAPEQLPEDVLADVMLANILAAPLVQLAPHLSAHTAAGAPLVLSGILREQESDIIAAYRPWCETHDTAYREEWVRLTLCRNRD